MKTFKDVQLNFKKNNQYTPTNAKVVLDSKNTDLGQFTLSVSYGSFAYGKGFDDTYEIALFERDKSECSVFVKLTENDDVVGYQSSNQIDAFMIVVQNATNMETIQNHFR